VVRPNCIGALTALGAMVATALVVVMVSYAPAEAQTAQDILKQPPFSPTDTSLFSPDVYPDAPPLTSPAEGLADEQTLRNQLNSLLQKRFGASNLRVRLGLVMFDSQRTKDIVPDPHLRAALVSLKGTIGEPAIAGTLDGTYREVRFADLSQFGDPIAAVVPPSGSNVPEILINEKFQYVDFRLYASTMAREPLHRDSRDSNVSNKEKLIADSIGALVYGQFLLESPELATSDTELARRNNTELMARINTRDAQGNLRLLSSTGNIFPNSKVTVSDFAATFEPFRDDIPGNQVLRGEVTKVVGNGARNPFKVNFDNTTVSLLDKKQGIFTAAQIVQLAKILKLDTSSPSITAAA
jgi:hypothetical protein